MTLHQELKIIRGVAKAVGDEDSAEQGLDILDLMAAGAFTLEADGWQPQIAAFDGVYAESTIVTGRTLIAGREQNITETIRVTAVADNYTLLYERVKRLQQFAQNARRFWTNFGEIEPVFLKWWALGAPGPQYALIYNINADVAYPDYSQSPRVDVTLTVEREPYWREIAPGAYPVRVVTGTKLANSCALDQFEEGIRDYLAGGLLYREERNFVDVDDVPGDAPALVTLSIEDLEDDDIETEQLFGSVTAYLALSARSKTVRNRNPETSIFYQGENLLRYHVLTCAAGDYVASPGGGLIGSTLELDTGGSLQKGADGTLSPTRRRIKANFTSMSHETARCVWQTAYSSDQDDRTAFDFTRHQGRYAVFVRMRQVGGSFGDITVRVGLGLEFQASPVAYLPEFDTGVTVSPLILGDSGNTGRFDSAGGYWPLTYCGILDIPPNGKSNSVLSDGNGLAAGRSTGLAADQTLAIFAGRNTGSADLYINDVVLMPLDEWLISGLFIDTTSYFSHGVPGPNTGTSTVEVRGATPYLLPGNNRIYGIFEATGNGNAAHKWSLEVRYVPRWRGVRDA